MAMLFFLCSFILTSNAETIGPFFRITCVTWEREREDETKIELVPTPVMQDLYHPADTAKGRKLKHIISCKPVCILWHQVLRAVVPCVWVTVS
jgi:hypothetical protein